MNGDPRDLLGCKVRDEATGREGVVTNVNHGLGGEVHVWIVCRPNEDGEAWEGYVEARRIKPVRRMIDHQGQFGPPETKA